MGIKRRRRETAIADPGLHKRGGQILAAIFECPFFYASPQKISDFLISPKNFIIYLPKIFYYLFFFFSHRPFICFNLLSVCQCYNSNKILGCLNPSFKLS